MVYSLGKLSIDALTYGDLVFTAKFAANYYALSVNDNGASITANDNLINADFKLYVQYDSKTLFIKDHHLN